jgi:drug/metabolite transporter (DMT)-like permease
MRIAVLTDIHANLEALEACLADAEAAGARRLIFLGDLVGYGADPWAVVARVRILQSEGAVVLRGNHDEAASFGPRGFAVGTAYSKTEAVQASIIAVVVLGEVLSMTSWTGIALSVGGVMYLTLAGRGLTPREILQATTQPAALRGISSGFCFALTAICIRTANAELPGEDVLLKALFSVVLTNAMQTVMQGGWLLWREPGQLSAVFRTWRDSAKVGALSAAGSSCWFMGFALAPVALVRAVGQVEILFTLLFSRFFLGEKLKLKDVVGALILVSGVVLVLLGAR